MLCKAEPDGFAVADMVAGLIYNFPGSDGNDSSVVLILLGIDTMRESTIELLAYDTKSYTSILLYHTNIMHVHYMLMNALIISNQHYNCGSNVE